MINNPTNLIYLHLFLEHLLENKQREQFLFQSFKFLNIFLEIA